MAEKDDFERTGAVFYGSVTINGPMFDIHDNQHVETHVHYAEPAPATRTPEGTLPDALRTPRAEALLARLVDAGLTDEHWQPLSLSNAEKGVLASLLADYLGVDNLWQTFGRLWGMNSKTLRSAFNKGMDQQRTNDFMERVKNALKGDDLKKI